MDWKTEKHELVNEDVQSFVEVLLTDNGYNRAYSMW